MRRAHDLFKSDAEIARIGQGLCDRTLPKSEWTHAGHFAAALWLLAKRPDLDVPREMPPLIRAYNVHTGVMNTATTGYHETITQASLRAAREFLPRGPEDSLHGRCNALLASKLGDPDWLLTHWSRERLFSEQARRFWVEPDIAPLAY